MKKFLTVLFYVMAAVYPVVVFTLLVVLKLPVRILSLCVMVLACSFFLGFTGRNRTDVKKEKKALDWRPMVSSALFLIAGIVCFVTNQSVFLKLYSVVISVVLLSVFGSTLFFEPNICFRFAVMSDKSIAGSSYEAQVCAYCRKVTVVWCCFFIINGSIAAYTALHDFGSEDLNNKIWSVYNGGISYILMGLLFSVELLVRKMVDKKMIKAFSFTKFNADSRPDGHIVCFEGSWSDGVYKTWKDFLTDSAKMRAFISQNPADDWILHCEDYWYFLCTFTALLQCGKRILLTQNISEAFIDEVKKPGVEFLTDQNATGSASIQDIIEKSDLPDGQYIRSVPQVDSDKTRILMFTSGSTGKPKAVPQRMTEFELDNAFIISKWAKEFTSRKLVTTVSQHHIYGFLFGSSLPFTLGVPFRRTRITFPEEFEKLYDTEYMIIATPAFLKRTVEIEEKLPLKNPFIFTSGGACSAELASSTEKVFGFCPLEVYGSTETSGIAYRQQNKDGLKFTPFDNAKIWLGDDGCLRIVSPYIKDPQGFATADLAEIFDDGRFILKGRSDSIVKIEEKRISMTEVENRIMQTGLVSDVKVVALQNDVRQYLAAAVVLNDKGKKQFENTEKYLVNRYFHDFLMQYFENVVLPKKWRFLDALPVDAQGKKHKLEIEALFEKQ
ncbi:AMP-binding protein [uncultured Treponema sp.]|uniref:AMP-binding protein n=1 Tax=uncultured Treponema sp. TaxID=162155 RepID=UPI002596DC74|nr:AMP-binding protein [uncultured Treponema sp.]